MVYKALLTLLIVLELLLMEGCNSIGAISGAGEYTGQTPQTGIVRVDTLHKMHMQGFLVELAGEQTTTTLKNTASKFFKQDVVTEPLFDDVNPDDDPYNLSRLHMVYVSEFPEDVNMWDAAYGLQDAGDFVRVEPDFENTSENAMMRAIVGCSGEGVPAPDDMDWSLRKLHVMKAWQLPVPTGGRRYGEGVRICHPDTGWTDHVELDADSLDLDDDMDFISEDDVANDPLDYHGHPGHGTSTGSVIVSKGGEKDTSVTIMGSGVSGVAPGATLVPIRSIKSVVQFLDSNVARAVRYSVTVDCDVISMSLGGAAFFGLERAIKDAVSRDIVVVTAAGNCVGVVVAPASYDETIAVAASNAEDSPWEGSSKGRAVSITAPGEDVYNARSDRNDELPFAKVAPGDGTSYAAAEVAGAAALWIAYHGKDRLVGTAGGKTLQEMYRVALKEGVDVPAGWNTDSYGPGILNVEKLLLQDPAALPDRIQVESALRESAKFLRMLANALDIPERQMEEKLRRKLGDDDFLSRLEQYGPELMYFLASEPEAFRRTFSLPGAHADAEALSLTESDSTSYVSNRLKSEFTNQ